MVENVFFHFIILTAFLFLLFLYLVFLFERNIYRIRWFFKRYSLLPGKIPENIRDIAFKALTAVGFMLFVRKFLYYIPFEGVIQTRFSIWWVDGKAQTYFFISIFVLFITGHIMKMLKDDIDEVGCGLNIIVVTVMAIFVFIVLNILLDNELKIEFPISSRNLLLIMFAPLLELKIICSGKYLGILSVLLLAFLFVFVNKKITVRATRHYAYIMITAGLMFLIFLGYSFYKSSNDWQQQLSNKVLSISVTRESDITDLLDAVHTIDQEKSRYEILKSLVSKIVNAGNYKGDTEICQRVIAEVETLSGVQSTKLLKKISLWVAASGKITWAQSIAQKIPNVRIRTTTLELIHQQIEKKR